MKFKLFAFFFCAIGILSAAPAVWDGANSFRGWEKPYHLRMSIGSRSMVLEITGRDSSISNYSVQINPAECNLIEIEYRAEGLPERTSGQIFYANASQKKFQDKQYWRFYNLKSDGKWHLLRLEANNANLANGMNLWTNCGMIDKLRLDMVDQFPGTIEIRRIFIGKAARLFPEQAKWPAIRPDNAVKAETAKSLLPYWKGYMIRSKGDTLSNILKGKNLFAFRRVISVPSDIRKAGLQITADDEYDLYLNGKKILSNHRREGWKSPNWADVTELLKKGEENIIAGYYRNLGNLGGILFELTMVKNDNSVEEIVSDDSFRSTTGFSEKYTDLHYDDSAWETMIPQSPPPARPWGMSVPFRDITPKPILHAVITEMPSKADAGSNLPVTLSVQNPPQETIPLLITFTTASGTVASQYTLPPDEIKVMENGKYELRLPLPKYFSSGKMTLAIQSPRAEFADLLRRSFDYRQAPKGKARSWRIRKGNGPPRLLMDGKPVYPVIGNTRFLHNESRFQDIPVTLRTFWARNGSYNSTPSWWLGPDEFDFSGIDQTVETMLSTDSRTPLLIFVGADMPGWWGKLNPSELNRFNDGKIFPTEIAPVSFASEKYRSDARYAVGHFLDHCLKAPYAHKIAGFVVVNGYTAEWQHYGSQSAAGENRLFDYSRPFRQGFLKFLAENYPDIPEEQRMVPKIQSRLARNGSVFLPEAGRRLNIACNEYLSKIMADSLCDIVRFTKQKVGPDRLVGTYYGYPFEHANMRWCVNLGGHNALKQVLDMPELDFILSPPSYTVRNLGDCGEDMKPFASITAAGKLSIIDDDTRTHLIPFSDFFQTFTAHHTRQILRRNMGRTLCRMEPLCLYALTYGIEFRSNAIAADIRTFETLASFALADGIQSSPEIAVVISERANFPLTYEKEQIPQEPRQLYGPDGNVIVTTRNTQILTGELLSYQRSRLAKIGAPVDYILAEDIARVAERPYKLWIFLNAFNPDETFVKTVETLRRKKNTLLWVYAPGVFLNGKPAPGLMTKLTGMNFIRRDAPIELVARFPDGHLMGSRDRTAPTFHPLPENSSTAIASWNSDIGHIAIARKKEGPSVSVFSGVVHLSPKFLRTLAEEAGVHIYADRDDILYANSAFISFHAAAAGRKTLRLPEAADIVDAFSGKILASGVKTWTFQARLHDSFLFYIGDSSSFPHSSEMR